MALRSTRIRSSCSGCGRQRPSSGPDGGSIIHGRFVAEARTRDSRRAMKPGRLTATVALDAGASLGEGPVWDPDTGRLLWVDIDAGEVHWFDPQAGTDRKVGFGRSVGAAAQRTAGGLILAVQEGFVSWEDGVERAVARVNDDPEIRMNDGKVDPAGRFWAGTMAEDERPGAGTLYRLDPDHSVHAMLGDVTISNGLDWSHDAQTMYFIDSMAGGIDALDYDLATGGIANRRRIIEIPESLGVPDGMTVDAADRLWVAIWGAGEVRRYDPGGSLLTVVDVAAEVTSCAFGGADLADLYITTALDEPASDASPDRADGPSTVRHGGSLFVCRTGVRGRPANRYLG
jgi:sugar lactone lactonase YvrE